MIEALPTHGVLLHIGLHKTGTTALQEALSSHRQQLAQRGVLFPVQGGRRHHHREAFSLQRDATVAWVPPESSPFQRWDRLVRRVGEHEGRVVISSEFFGHCTSEEAQKAVADLGADRVQVLLGLRNIGELLPSTWQQYLKGGYLTPYEEWLRAILAPQPPPEVTPKFWPRNDVGQQLQRWLTALGADRIHVVVLDKADRTLLFRTCAGLLDVPLELVTAEPGALRGNRSMTMPEAELVRRTNERIGEIGSRAFWKLYSFGAVRAMVEERVPPRDEPLIGLPDWAAERARAIGQAHAVALRSSGVRTYGDPANLERAARSSPIVEVGSMPIDAAAEALAGMLRVAERTQATQPPAAAQSRPKATPSVEPAGQRVTDASGRELLAQLGRRARRRLRGPATAKPGRREGSTR